MIVLTPLPRVLTPREERVLLGFSPILAPIDSPSSPSQASKTSMALSSLNGLRRVLRGPSSSLLPQWHRCSSPSSPRSSFSTLFHDDDSNKNNDPPLSTPKLFVSGLSRLTTNEKLKEAFSSFGQLLEAQVITDRVSGRSKGFGFVRYATIEEAEKAREGMNAKFLDGWVIFVDPAKPRAPKPPPTAEQEPPETGFRTNKTIGWCGR